MGAELAEGGTRRSTMVKWCGKSGMETILRFPIGVVQEIQCD